MDVRDLLLILAALEQKRQQDLDAECRILLKALEGFPGGRCGIDPDGDSWGPRPRIALNGNRAVPQHRGSRVTSQPEQKRQQELEAARQEALKVLEEDPDDSDGHGWDL